MTTDSVVICVKFGLWVTGAKKVTVGFCKVRTDTASDSGLL